MLTARDVAYLACRILAFCLLVQNISQLITAVTYLGSQVWEVIQGEIGGSRTIMITLMANYVFWYLGLIWLVWSNANWISRKIVPDERNAEIWPRVRLVDLQVAAFSVLGVYFFVSGMQRAFSIGVSIMQVLTYNYPDESVLDWLLTGDSASMLVGIVGGLLLMFGSGGLVRLIRRIRGAGTPASDLGEDDQTPAPRPEQA